MAGRTRIGAAEERSAFRERLRHRRRRRHRHRHRQLHWPAPTRGARHAGNERPRWIEPEARRDSRARSIARSSAVEDAPCLERKKQFDEERRVRPTGGARGYPRDANERQDMGESAAIARNFQELPAIAGNFGNSHASRRDKDFDPFRHAPRTLDRAPPPAEESQPEGAVRTMVDGPPQAPRTPSLRSPAATAPRPRAASPPPPSPASGGA